MIDQIIQYLPQGLVTLGAVAVPMIPAFITKAVTDKKAITTFESIKAESKTQLTEIKDLAVSLKQKEETFTRDISQMKNMTETFKTQIDRIEIGVDRKMKEVSDQVLSFQKDDVYQKMLNGLSQLDQMQKAMILKDELIEKQAQVIKEIHQKLGSMT